MESLKRIGDRGNANDTGTGTGNGEKDGTEDLKEGVGNSAKKGAKDPKEEVRNEAEDLRAMKGVRGMRGTPAVKDTGADENRTGRTDSRVNEWLPYGTSSCAYY